MRAAQHSFRAPPRDQTACIDARPGRQRYARTTPRSGVRHLPAVCPAPPCTARRVRAPANFSAACSWCPSVAGVIRDECGEVRGRHTDRVAHAHVREVATVAQLVHGRSAHPESLGDLADAQQVIGATTKRGERHPGSRGLSGGSRCLFCFARLPRALLGCNDSNGLRSRAKRCRATSQLWELGAASSNPAAPTNSFDRACGSI